MPWWIALPLLLYFCPDQSQAQSSHTVDMQSLVNEFKKRDPRGNSNLSRVLVFNELLTKDQKQHLATHDYLLFKDLLVRASRLEDDQSHFLELVNSVDFHMLLEGAKRTPAESLALVSLTSGSDFLKKIIDMGKIDLSLIHPSVLDEIAQKIWKKNDLGLYQIYGNFLENTGYKEKYVPLDTPPFFTSIEQDSIENLQLQISPARADCAEEFSVNGGSSPFAIQVVNYLLFYFRGAGNNSKVTHFFEGPSGSELCSAEISIEVSKNGTYQFNSFFGSVHILPRSEVQKLTAVELSELLGR